MPIAQAQSVSDTFTNLLSTVLQAIPLIIVFLLILLVGYIVARLVRTAIEKVLKRIGLDRTLHENEYGSYVEKASPGASPSRLIGTIAYFFVLLGALSVAVAYTGNPGLTAFLAGIYAYLPKVAAAILIFVVAGAVSGAAGGFVHRTMGDTSTGQIVKTVLPALIMAIAVFMMLDQLEIAPTIVAVAFQALMFGAALGLALAFGLGGRDTANKMISDAYQKGQEKRGEVRRDIETGKERGQQDAEQAKQRAQAEHQQRSGGGDTQQVAPGGAPAPGREPGQGGAPAPGGAQTPGQGGTPGQAPGQPRQY